MAINELEFEFEDFSPGLITLREGENSIAECVARKIYLFFLGTNQWNSIIAVHGLGANPNYAWKHKIETKEGGKLVWP